jgi:hypothetical protein
VGSSAINMGEMRAGGGLGGSMPDSVSGMLSQVPDSVAAQVTGFFKDLFNMDFIMGEFARSMRTTYLFSIALMVVGGLLALVVRGRAKKP